MSENTRSNTHIQDEEIMYTKCGSLRHWEENLTGQK